MPTYVPPVKSKSAKWHVIDANGKVLGRIATSAAKILQGKHTANYTPYLDMGDPDGARAILEEVLSEGSPSQKIEAQRLVETLPG